MRSSKNTKSKALSLDGKEPGQARGKVTHLQHRRPWDAWGLLPGHEAQFTLQQNAAHQDIPAEQIQTRNVRIRSYEPIHLDDGDHIIVTGLSSKDTLNALAYTNLTSNLSIGYRKPEEGNAGIKQHLMRSAPMVGLLPLLEQFSTSALGGFSPITHNLVQVAILLLGCIAGYLAIQSLIITAAQGFTRTAKRLYLDRLAQQKNEQEHLQRMRDPLYLAIVRRYMLHLPEDWHHSDGYRTSQFSPQDEPVPASKTTTP